MKMKILSCLLVIAMTLPLASCFVTSRDTHVEISCDDFGAHPTSSRNDFEIDKGDKVFITLCSNPSTGFEWSYEMSGDPSVKEEDHDFAEPDSSAPGTPGKETWTFEGVESGTAEISMEYSQPWEGGTKQEWTYTVTIKVE